MAMLVLRNVCWSKSRFRITELRHALQPRSLIMASTLYLGKHQYV